MIKNFRENSQNGRIIKFLQENIDRNFSYRDILFDYFEVKTPSSRINELLKSGIIEKSASTKKTYYRLSEFGKTYNIGTKILFATTYIGAMGIQKSQETIFKIPEKQKTFLEKLKLFFRIA